MICSRRLENVSGMLCSSPMTWPSSCISVWYLATTILVSVTKSASSSIVPTNLVISSPCRFHISTIDMDASSTCARASSKVSTSSNPFKPSVIALKPFTMSAIVPNCASISSTVPSIRAMNGLISASNASLVASSHCFTNCAGASFKSSARSSPFAVLPNSPCWRSPPPNDTPDKSTSAPSSCAICINAASAETN